MHTHFGSATQFLCTMVYVLLGLTLWRLAWMHGLTSRNETVAGLSRAAIFQA
jgi:hypothetical protein